MLHYTALRLSSELRVIGERLTVDLGVMGAAQALALLLEVCTVRSTDDPRAGSVTMSLSRAGDQLGTAAERIDTLFAACRDVASIIYPPPVVAVVSRGQAPRYRLCSLTTGKPPDVAAGGPFSGL